MIEIRTAPNSRETEPAFPKFQSSPKLGNLEGNAAPRTLLKLTSAIDRLLCDSDYSKTPFVGTSCFA